MAYLGKILIIVENLPVPFDARVWQEANALTDAGYKVSVICPVGKGHEQKYEEINGISIYRYFLPLEGDGVLGYLIEYSSSLFWQALLSVKVFFREGFDVVQACNPPDNIFLIGLFYKLFGKKFVFDHHDINPELYIAKYKKQDVFYKLMLLLEKLTFKCADISLATNKSYREIAIQRGGMDPEKVFVVRSGPNLDRLRLQDSSDELKEGKKHLVGYVGVIGQQEGLDYILEAARYIRSHKKRDDILFAVIGDGPNLEAIKKRCSDLDLNGTFKFLGRVPDDVMLKYLNTADICVNPDEYNAMNDKSTMNKIMEYMALGKPIVQFDLKEGRYSAQEASLYAKNNDPIDMAEKILYLLEDEALRKKMGEYGRNRIESELNWNKSKAPLIKAYDYLFNYNRDQQTLEKDSNIKISK